MVKPRTLQPEEWELWDSWMQAQRLLARELDRDLQRDYGISKAEFSVLVTLHRAPGGRMRVSELVESLAWEKSRVSHQVARMEARGLLERSECDTDGRGTWVGITAEGRRTLLASTRDHAAAIRTLFFDELSDDEKAALSDVSRRILERLNPPECDLEAPAAPGSSAA